MSCSKRRPCIICDELDLDRFNHFNQSNLKDFMLEWKQIILKLSQQLSYKCIRFNTTLKAIDERMLMVKKERRESWKKLFWILRFSSVVFSWSRRLKVFKPILKLSSVRTWIRTRLISAHWNCTTNRKNNKVRDAFKRRAKSSQNQRDFSLVLCEKKFDFTINLVLNKRSLLTSA